MEEQVDVVPEVEEESTEVTEVIEPVEDATEVENEEELFEDPASTEILVTSPVDPREMTVLETEKGDIHVLHEITLGDAVLSTLIMVLLIFQVLDRIIRR